MQHSMQANTTKIMPHIQNMQQQKQTQTIKDGTAKFSKSINLKSELPLVA